MRKTDLLKLQQMLRNLIIGPKLVQRFCFFKDKISQKSGQKCCRYNQNGQPLVLDKAKQLLVGLNTFMQGWKIQQQGKRLKKYYYIENYPSVLNFISEVVSIDANQFKQCPSYHVTNGQILCLELYSISLKGLSMMDFQLAMRINNINFIKYHLLELKDVQNYKKEITKIRMERQSKKIQKMLDQDQKNWKKQNKNQNQLQKQQIK